jgi:hypothetical protein
MRAVFTGTPNMESQNRKGLFAIVPDRFPVLTTLILALGPGPLALDYVTIQPLVTRCALRKFELCHDLPLILCPNDIVNIAQGLGPSIVDIDLNYNPQGVTTLLIPAPQIPALTMSAIIPSAEHCPKLQILALYVDATSPPSPPNRIKRRSEPFELRFGVSPTKNAGPVIDFLREVRDAVVHILDEMQEDPAFNKTWTTVTGVVETLPQQDAEIEARREEVKARCDEMKQQDKESSRLRRALKELKKANSSSG